jgi:hypothetical protein
VITDVDMPGGLTGLDLAAMVATVRHSTKIIVTSGRSAGSPFSVQRTYRFSPWRVERQLIERTSSIVVLGMASVEAI